LAIEAIAGHGVRAIKISEIKTSYDIFRIKEGFSYNLDKTIAYLTTNLNRHYDYLGVLFLGILKLISKIRKSFKGKANKWQREKDYFCSELSRSAFMAGGLDIVPQVSDAAVTSPRDIAASPLLEKMG